MNLHSFSTTRSALLSDTIIKKSSPKWVDNLMHICVAVHHLIMVQWEIRLTLAFRRWLKRICLLWSAATLSLPLINQRSIRGRFALRAADQSQAEEPTAAQKINELMAHIDALTHELQITQRELHQAQQGREEFLQIVNHELRTPLSVIISFTELLRQRFYGPLTERQAQALFQVNENAAHLLTLVKNMLDMAALVSGHFILYPETIDLAEVCQASIECIQAKAQQKGITISHPVYTDALLVHAEGRRLKQALLSLLDNAVKFTPPGGQIGLDVTQVSKQTCLTVWDTGIGIAPQDHGRLFKPFSQIDAGLNRQYEGAGLSLVLAKQLIELHQGRLNVESELGKGSRFTIQLPV